MKNIITCLISSPYKLLPPPSLCGFNTNRSGASKAIFTAFSPFSS